MTMSPLRLCLLLLSCHMLPFFTAQASCVGRCGEPFSRGQLCNCDDNCLAHDECCKDFEAVCTSSKSCSGRCGEKFLRGRVCECDSDCSQHNTCCPDYQARCGSGTEYKPKPGVLIQGTLRLRQIFGS
ncbi:proteoglycan 4-like [Denticeps clupeoides]|uniref:proteoglycan 4-like n=1 Tax=Denticeps clupeoides TaxID=299321 RepID=UPI0010A38E70|nr:proteoglycan 4-like [Denticeps clupeoides]